MTYNFWHRLIESWIIGRIDSLTPSLIGIMLTNLTISPSYFILHLDNILAFNLKMKNYCHKRSSPKPLLITLHTMSLSIIWKRWISIFEIIYWLIKQFLVSLIVALSGEQSRLFWSPKFLWNWLIKKWTLTKWVNCYLTDSLFKWNLPI